MCRNKIRRAGKEEEESQRKEGKIILTVMGREERGESKGKREEGKGKKKIKEKRTEKAARPLLLSASPWMLRGDSRAMEA